ncbi:MAG: hypothetical protein ABGW97_02995 [Christiangramia sp.]|uniref:hypothetical protein n=1 Tax=Christiangramia sp. TaxID=1931228 RepID=UPI0032426514
MKNTVLDNFGNNDPWKHELKGLKTDNVEQIYEQEFTEWKIFFSDSRRLDGKVINTDKFLEVYVGNGFEKIKACRFETNDKNEGFPLKEEYFIKEKINKYEYILNATEGSALNRTIHMKCELFLNYLRKRLKKFKKNNTPETSPELQLNQIALLIFYEGGGVYKDNCDSTAEEYGWNSKTSGHKLYQYFNKLRDKSERIGDPGSKRKLNNKIDLLESVVPHLSDTASQKAKTEIAHLRNLFAAHYE